MSELLPPVRSESASSSRQSGSRGSLFGEEGAHGVNGLFSSSSGAALVEDSKEGAEGDLGHFPGREAAEDDDDDVSESPTMGEDFYKGVEGLLSKPAPTLRHFCKTNGGPAGPSLPVLRKQRSDLRRGKPATGGAATTVGSKGEKRAARPRGTGTGGAKPGPSFGGGEGGDGVDLTKVAEALQFCEGLQLSAAQDVGPGDGDYGRAAAPRRQGTGARAAPYASPAEKKDRRRESRRQKHGSGPTRSSDDVSATYGVATASRRSGGGGGGARAKEAFDATSNRPPRDPRRVAPDEVDALVRNFEGGHALRELRKQLHESQKSMETSQNALRSAAAEFRASRP